jgi:hypothetical protein
VTFLGRLNAAYPFSLMRKRRQLVLVQIRGENQGIPESLMDVISLRAARLIRKGHKAIKTL